MSNGVLLTRKMSTPEAQESPCELVYEHGDPNEIASMLGGRHAKGWVLDRIIKHHLPSQQFGGPTNPRLVIYYFKKKN